MRRGGHVVHAVPPTMHLAAGDVLYFTGQTRFVQAVAREYGLEFVSEALGGGDVRGALLGMPGPRRQRRASPFAAAADTFTTTMVCVCMALVCLVLLFFVGLLLSVVLQIHSVVLQIQSPANK